MTHIIDAYNLAYALAREHGQFGHPNPDKKETDEKLIKVIRTWLGQGGKKAILVFDSYDPMGDKIKSGNLEIIYVPHDNFYKSADDKIIEITKNLSANEKEIVIVTDDEEIKTKINEFKGSDAKIKFESAITFAKKLLRRKKTSDLDDNGLGADDIDAINQELLKRWKK